MATALQDKIDSRASLWEQMKACDLDNAEDAAKYDRLEKEYDALDEVIERNERHQEKLARNSKVNRTGAGDPSDNDPKAADEQFGEGYTDAFNTWMRQGERALSHEQHTVLQKGWQDAPQAAAGTGTGAAGGFTVPPAFRQKIIERLAFVAQMRQLAEVITTDTGANLPWPTVDETGVEGAIVGENTATTEQDPTFGNNSLDAYMYSSKIVRASLQLLQDNGFDFESWLAKALGARIGRIQNRHFTVGTGVGQPDGLFTNAAVGVTAASATAVTGDELVDMSESLDPVYLDSPDVGWMFAQTTRGKLRKLKKADGDFMWQPGLQAGKPSTLLGYPVKLNNHVPAIGAAAKSIGFGDIREAYVVRDVSGFALMRLVERYAEYFQVGFLGFQRTDGTLQNSAAFKTLQQAAS